MQLMQINNLDQNMCKNKIKYSYWESVNSELWSAFLKRDQVTSYYVHCRDMCRHQPSYKQACYMILTDTVILDFSKHVVLKRYLVCPSVLGMNGTYIEL